MSKHHHHNNRMDILDKIASRCCIAEQREEAIIDKIVERCGYCCDRRPEAVLPAELSPEDIRRLRCFFDCLCQCVCRPGSSPERVAGAEDAPRRRRFDDCQC